jgi:hypothetical protein
MPPNTIIKWADDLKEAMVIGYDSNDELYVAGTSSDVAKCVLLLELAKKHMLEYLEVEDGQ